MWALTACTLLTCRSKPILGVQCSFALPFDGRECLRDNDSESQHQRPHEPPSNVLLCSRHLNTNYSWVVLRQTYLLYRMFKVYIFLLHKKADFECHECQRVSCDAELRTVCDKYTCQRDKGHISLASMDRKISLETLWRKRSERLYLRRKRTWRRKGSNTLGAWQQAAFLFYRRKIEQNKRLNQFHSVEIFDTTSCRMNRELRIRNSTCCCPSQLKGIASKCLSLCCHLSWKHQNTVVHIMYSCHLHEANPPKTNSTRPQIDTTVATWFSMLVP